MKYGLSVYSCQDVQSTHTEVKTLKKGIKAKIGSFTIQPIPLKHSAECYGFLVCHNSLGRLVFCTDCESFPYKIKNVHHFLIEANYSEDIAIDNMCNGFDNRSMSGNHLEINNTIAALKCNYSPNLQTVVLLHLSNGNSNAEKFKEMAQHELGFNNVYIADKGLTIDLSKDEF